MFTGKPIGPWCIERGYYIAITATCQTINRLFPIAFGESWCVPVAFYRFAVYVRDPPGAQREPNEFHAGYFTIRNELHLLHILILSARRLDYQAFGCRAKPFRI